MPEWLTYLAIISLLVAAGSALIILIDIVAGHPQHMWIMNVGLAADRAVCGAAGRVGSITASAGSQRTGDARGERARRKAVWPSRSLSGKASPSPRPIAAAAARWATSWPKAFLIFVPLTLFGMQHFRRLGGRLRGGVPVRHRVSIFHDQTDANIFRRARAHRRRSRPMRCR